MQPAAPAVRETLERLLASETFGRSERARELLRYLVERQQAGEADRLKGFSIAVDVFGKDAGFDSSTDAVVRVQAGRLRDLLNQYFTTEGIADPLRIVIPRGSYVPAYETNAMAGTPALMPAEKMADGLRIGAAASPPKARPRITTLSIMRQLRFFWAVMALVVVMLGVLLFRQSSLPLIEASEAPRTITGSIAESPVGLPVVYIALKTEGAAAERVATTLRAGLSSFDTVDFIGRDMAGLPGTGSNALSFVFEVLPGPSADGVTVELQNVSTGRVLLSRSLGATETQSPKLDDRIADMLTATIPASGAVYNYVEQNDLQQGLTQCLLLGEKYYLDQNADSHKAAYSCLEALAREDVKSPLVYSELAALQLEAATKRLDYPVGASAEQARRFARRAIQMGSTSATVHRSYGYLKSRLGETEPAIDWMRKAYELNRYDLGMAASYGYGLIFAARYAEGTPILARAVRASSAHPTWWDFGLFVGRFMLGDVPGAKRASDALTTTAPKSHYIAVRIISAKAAGDSTEVRRLEETLTQEFPNFVADPRKVFMERNYPADLVNRLVEALREAGIPHAG